jgi:hypothetical protein
VQKKNNLLQKEVKEQIPTLNEMEIAIAKAWNYRNHLIVPNVSWGFGVHECDLLVVSKFHYATEIEIKRSRADLIKDSSKPHAHQSTKIKYLYFAIPKALQKCMDLIPEHAGVILVKRRNITKKTPHPGFYAKVLRKPLANAEARKLTAEEVDKVARLGCMRIWDLKLKVMKYQTTTMKSISKISTEK